MKKFAKIVGLFYLGVLAAITAPAQSITGTVIDGNFVTWTNAIVKAHLNNPSGAKPLNAFTLAPVVTDFSVTTATDGTFNLNFGTLSPISTVNILPGGTTWQIFVCPFIDEGISPSGSCQLVTTLPPTQGAGSIGGFSAVLKPLTISLGRFPGAYNDNEITNPVYGSCYLLPAPSIRCRVNNVWTTVTSGTSLNNVWTGKQTFTGGLTNSVGFQIAVSPTQAACSANSTCTATFTLPVTEPDTNYVVTGCIVNGLTAGTAVVENALNSSVTTFLVNVFNFGAIATSTYTVNCLVIHS